MTGEHRAVVRRPPTADGRTLVDVVPVPTPAAGDGDLLVAPVISGICGTDWQILRGARNDPTPTPGHEGFARVVTDSGDFAAGDLVTVNPTHPTDPTFLLGHNVSGLLAERTLIPARAVTAGLVVPVGEGGPPSALTAALAEPLASAIYGLQIARSGPRPRSLVVWGDGIIGGLAIRLWSRAFPGLTVLVVTRVDSDAPDLPDRLRALPGPVAAVLATPRSATTSALVTLDRHIDAELLIDVHGGLAPGPVALRSGEVDVATVRAANCGGAPSDPITRSLPRPGARPIQLFGHRGVSNDHIRAAIEMLTSDPSTFLPLLTHVVDLDGAAVLINDVLTSGRRIHDGREVLKAAVVFDEAGT